MKIVELSLVLNRHSDLPVSAIIIPNEDDTEASLIINFRSFTAYKQFLKKPVLTETNFGLYDDYLFSTKNIAEWTKSEDFINKLHSSRLQCQLSKSSKNNEIIFKQKLPITIDIRNLSYQDKMAVLTNPLLSDNICFLDSYTEREEVPLKDIIEMYKFILNIANKIKANGYSQVESIYCIYNALKNRIYNEEKEGESLNKSRSLNHVINGNNIVCSGYTNYFLAIADILGLNVERILWEPIDNFKAGHSSIIAFVNDDKYDIQGVWAIDPTWDSKRNEEDNEYQNSLAHFMMSMKYDEAEKRIHHLGKPHENIYHSIFNSMERYKYLLEYQAPEVITKNAKNILLKKINRFYKSIGMPEINADVFDPQTEFTNIKMIGSRNFPILKLEEIIDNVTPRDNEETIKVMQTTCTYKCMSDDGKSVYRFIRTLNL